MSSKKGDLYNFLVLCSEGDPEGCCLSYVKVSCMQKLIFCFLFERMVASLSWLSLALLQGFVNFLPNKTHQNLSFKNMRGENGGVTIRLHAAQECLIAQMHFKCNRKPDGLLFFFLFR